MQKLILLFLLLLAFAACNKSNLEGNYPACIQKKINNFTQQETSWSVKWTEFKGQAVYKFSSVIEDVYLNGRCDTICQYALVSSFLPHCKLEIDNAADWQIIWEK